jgi:membrane fusion protein (multidrug efflux system)
MARVLLTACVVSTGVACSRNSSGAVAPQATIVKVTQVAQKDVPIYREWIGTLDGLVNADIKAQVSGYLTEQAYTEGSFVKKGQLLFQIDPRPFDAALAQAQGQLAQASGQLEQARAQLQQSEAEVLVAEATQRRTQLDVDRYVPLAQQQAITTQDLDNATQNNMAAVAQVQASRAHVATARAQIAAANAAVQSAKANVDTAQINLGFTRVTSPIDGIPGIAQLQVGALVTPASGVMTTVSTLDPIRAYITVSEQEYLDLNRRFPNDQARQEHLRERVLEMTLADGSVYPRTGKFFFADRQVDVRTGAIRMAGLFANPENYLRPGQYAKIRIAISTLPGALLVPQQAVLELQGSHLIAVVNPDNTVDIHPVTLGETVGHDWIVSAGLKPGERVIAEGLQKVRQGMHVNPQPFVRE